MAAFPTEDRVRQKRTKSEQAISLAMKNRWEEAAQLNREILDMFPNEVDAFNRLGKALTELGRYGEARDAYAKAVKIDPLNGIATKNLQRLGKLAAEGSAAPPVVIGSRLASTSPISVCVWSCPRGRRSTLPFCSFALSARTVRTAT